MRPTSVDGSSADPRSPHMHLARLLLVTAVVALVACSGSDAGRGDPDAGASAAIPVEQPTGFYAYAEPLGGVPAGTLLRSEPVDVPGAGSVVATRILYVSSDHDGAPIPVSGFALVAAGAAPAGGRPVLAWAHGTVGLGDACAPSRDVAANVPPNAATFLRNGGIVVATDYAGLGTAGLHPYLNGPSEGRAVLDGVRAASQLPGASLLGPVVLAGHSQGGHAVLFAGELAAGYAPDVAVRGVVAYAPASDLAGIPRAVAAGGYLGYLPMALLGLLQEDGGPRPHDVLTPAALADLPVVATGCGGAVTRRYAGVAWEDVVRRDPASVPAIREVFERNSPGSRMIGVPVLVVHGAVDEQIPAEASARLRDRYCAAGQPVEVRTYPGASHGAVVQEAQADVIAWIDALLGDELQVPSC